MKEYLTLELTTDELKELISSSVAEAFKRVANEIASDSQNELMLDKKQVMTLLKISSFTLWNRMKDGSIPFKKIGRRVLFSKKEVLNAINNVTHSNRKMR